jgi:hypothetical protein
MSLQYHSILVQDSEKGQQDLSIFVFESITEREHTSCGVWLRRLGCRVPSALVPKQQQIVPLQSSKNKEREKNDFFILNASNCICIIAGSFGSDLFHSWTFEIDLVLELCWVSSGTWIKL